LVGPSVVSLVEPSASLVARVFAVKAVVHVLLRLLLLLLLVLKTLVVVVLLVWLVGLLEGVMWLLGWLGVLRSFLFLGLLYRLRDFLSRLGRFWGWGCVLLRLFV